ncbi:V-type proton ATPase subunit G 3 [Latimeria chalumnae]|uniref:V-type proton ATPase subunit G 3 n=1 Tax=Latimeria chalumnae TaxID=7897 RepID=UPI0003C0FF5F|nr:PREDICTED: V-type proton ATPase subunit G 3 [Latimeria chalumnae]|eukprot:XP_006012346.1 PREDICTED: V-type proton ATPase subunit G 3 [Latimeria chalumnae]
MASQSQGIQHLLQAEKRAKEKLDEAKKRKGKRLKQAKDEAMAEIDQYRLQRENEFRHKQASILGSQGNLSAKVEEQSTAKSQTLTSTFHLNKEKVIQGLLDMVYNIKPEVHCNFRE